MHGEECPRIHFSGSIANQVECPALAKDRLRNDRRRYAASLSFIDESRSADA